MNAIEPMRCWPNIRIMHLQELMWQVIHLIGYPSIPPEAVCCVWVDNIGWLPRTRRCYASSGWRIVASEAIATLPMARCSVVHLWGGATQWYDQVVTHTWAKYGYNIGPWCFDVFGFYHICSCVFLFANKAILEVYPVCIHGLCIVPASATFGVDNTTLFPNSPNTVQPTEKGLLGLVT